MTVEGYHEGVLTVRRAAAAAAVCGEGSLTMSGGVAAFAFLEQCTLSRLSPADAAGVAGGYGRGGTSSGRLGLWTK